MNEVYFTSARMWIIAAWKMQPETWKMQLELLLMPDTKNINLKFTETSTYSLWNELEWYASLLMFPRLMNFRF
jgi:hypothetical protein